jgi:hypothetical protein
MSSRSMTFIGFAVIVAACVGWSAVAPRTGRVSLPRLLARLTRSRLARLVVVLAWAWLGWHLFARGSGAFE